MSSRRFPGKVLAPFRGVPIVTRVVDAVSTAFPEAHCAVLTSTEASDDPLAAYLVSRGVRVFRGALDDVVGRFVQAVDEDPTEWVMRICADGPLQSPSVMRAVASRAADDVDLVTTTFPRSFPRGQNVEMIRTRVLRALEDEPLTAEDREHVTGWLYRHADRYRIVNVSSGDPSLAALSLAVDDVDDLRRLESLSEADLTVAR